TSTPPRRAGCSAGRRPSTWKRAWSAPSPGTATSSRPRRPSLHPMSLPERVAVTGATGFIGRRLVPALLFYGCRVTSFARPPVARERAALGHPLGDRHRWAGMDLEDPAS